MIWEVNSKATHDHIGIFNENNNRIKVTFDEKKYKQHTVLIADSGSVFELILQEKTTEKLEAIQKIIKIPDVWSHPDPIEAIREILESSIDNGVKRTE